MNDAPDCVILRAVVDCADSADVDATKSYFEQVLNRLGVSQLTTDVPYEKFEPARKIEYLLRVSGDVGTAFNSLVCSLMPLEKWNCANGESPDAIWQRGDEVFSGAPAVRWICIEPWYDIQHDSITR